MTNQITEKQKKEMMFHHFLYEVSSLLNVNLLTKIEYPNIHYKNIGENILVDNILLHSRNLLSFYYQKPNNSHFSFAKHFIENWNSLKPTKTFMIKELERRVHNECCHLTYKRLIGGDHKKWNLHQLRIDLLKITKLFLENLDKKYLTGNLKNFKDNLDKYLEAIKK
jgi:hypothetical protein